MISIKCTTKEEVLEAIKRGHIPEVYGDVSFVLRVNCTVRTLEGSPHIEVQGASSATIEAFGTSSPCIETWGASSPKVIAYDKSSPLIDTYESSRPRIVGRLMSSPKVRSHGVYSQGIIWVDQP
jgi:hypothetical protein